MSTCLIKMKSIGLLLLLLNFQAMAQESWLTNFEEAKKRAVEEDKHILMVFAGSDWCAPCIKLEKQVLDTDEFIQNTKEQYVLIKVDFPRRKKNRLSPELQQQNNDLAEKYNRSGGFPLVVVLNTTGKKLGEVGYEKVTPKEYIVLLNEMIKQ